MNFCSIIAENEEDYQFLSGYLKQYPVLLERKFDFNKIDDVLLVGWNITKKYFPKQNIIDKKINNNTQWTYSKQENEDQLKKDIEEFINNSIKKWLPKHFITFDSLFNNQEFWEFCKEHFESRKHKMFLYYYKGGVYINFGEENFIINLKSLDIISNNSINIITEFINKYKPIVLSYKNISPIVDIDQIQCLYTFENIKWIKHGQEVTEKYFEIIRGYNIKKFIPFIMKNTVKFEFNEIEKKSLQRACGKDKITEWLSQQEICIKDKINKKIDYRFDKNNIFHTPVYSNKRTITGRITTISRYNVQSLPKNTNDRKNIISRFNNGRIVVFDYISFESRIALYFCDDQDYIYKNYLKDFHYEIAKIIYQRDYVNIEEREFSKIINLSILYGASKNNIIKKIQFANNPEYIYYKIRDFLYPIVQKSEKIKKQERQFGYIINDWGTIVYVEKNYAAFNNYIQSIAVEIIVDKIMEIKKILTNYKSKFLFQVHDSLVFDIHPEEKELVNILAKNISNYKWMKFATNYSYGNNFKELSEPVKIFI